MTKRLMTVCLLAATAVLGAAPAADAALCGESRAGGEPVLGSLLLRSADSITTLSFERDKEVRRLIMEFDVEGCELLASNSLQVAPRSSDLDEAVFEKAKIEPEGNSLFVAVPVDPEQFDPGQHSASLTVRGLLITPTRVKVSVQRTEPAFKPTALALVAIVAGILAALAVSAAAAGTSFRKGWFPGLTRLGTGIVLAVVAGGAVWWSSYGDAEVWEWELGTWGPLAFGAVTAAYGAASGAFQAKKNATPK